MLLNIVDGKGPISNIIIIIITPKTATTTTTVQVRIPPWVSGRVGSDLGLGGVLRRVLWFPPPFTTG